MNLTPTKMVEKLLDRLHRKQSEEDILDWLNSAQDYIAGLRDDWRFLHDLDNTITTVDGQADYDLADDFAWPLNFRDYTNNRKLVPKSLTWLYKQDPVPSTEGPPTYYILLGPVGTDNVEKVRFWHVPDTDDEVIKYDYYKTLPDLSMDTDVPSLIPDHQLLMDIAQIRGMIAGEEDDDKQWLPEVEKQLGPRLQTLMRRQRYNPDRDTGMKRHSAMTMAKFGA